MEAVFAASFSTGLGADERHTVAAVAAASYPTTRTERHHGINIDVDTDEVAVGEAETLYRLESEDGTELLLVRPEGINTSQLAPYKSWDVLLERFRRDLGYVWGRYPEKRVNRIAVRSINRIDVPLVEGLAHFEDYLGLHIRLPADFPPIGPFQLQLSVSVPEAKAVATIRSGVMEPAIEGKASFLLDIDLTRTRDIPEDHDGVIQAFNELREPKNHLYRTFLTAKALKEF